MLSAIATKLGVFLIITAFASGSCNLAVKPDDRYFRGNLPNTVALG